MSARITKKSTINATKPYCKVCHDAGKSEKEYTSHYVRASPEPNSAVVCPTLLSLQCGFCAKSGHTPAYCTELAKKKKADEKASKQRAFQEKQEQQRQQQKQEIPIAKRSSTNAFSAAFDSDCEDETPPAQKKQVAKMVIAKQPMMTSASKTQLSFNLDQYPALPKASASATKSASASATKSAPAFLTALKQIHPELNVPSKMAQDKFVNARSMQNTTVVLNKQQQEERQHSATIAEDDDASEDAYPAAVEVSAFYEEALSAFKRTQPDASTLNWAEVDVDSDDEDW